MIRIVIETDGEKIFDSFKKKNTTLLENSLVIRRLEELKMELLSIQYDSELEVRENKD